MSDGLQVFNSDGILQITDTFKNIQFISKQTLTLPSTAYRWYFDNYYPYYSTAVISATAILNNLIACRSDNGKLITWDIIYPVLSYPPFVYGNPSIRFFGEVGAVITIYFFSYASIPAGTHFEVINSDGERVFSDNAKFMKVLDSRMGTLPGDLSLTGTPTITSTTTHASTVKTAVALGNRSYYERTNSNGRTGYVRYLAFDFNDITTVGQSTCIYSAHSDNWYPDYQPGVYTDFNYHYTVLDVTGL